jgi:hypothetical protein
MPWYNMAMRKQAWLMRTTPGGEWLRTLVPCYATFAPKHTHTASCAVGNPQQLGQKPLTYNRQILALCMSPELLANPKAQELFPSDAIARAKELMAHVGSVGAYSDSRGAAGIRQEVANFIERRDGCARLMRSCMRSLRCSVEQSFLCCGPEATMSRRTVCSEVHVSPTLRSMSQHPACVCLWTCFDRVMQTMSGRSAHAGTKRIHRISF